MNIQDNLSINITYKIILISSITLESATQLLKYFFTTPSDRFALYSAMLMYKKDDVADYIYKISRDDNRAYWAVIIDDLDTIKELVANGESVDDAALPALVLRRLQILVYLSTLIPAPKLTEEQTVNFRELEDAIAVNDNARISTASTACLDLPNKKK